MSSIAKGDVASQKGNSSIAEPLLSWLCWFVGRDSDMGSAHYSLLREFVTDVTTHENIVKLTPIMEF